MALIGKRVLKLRASFVISNDKDPTALMIENLPRYYKNYHVLQMLESLAGIQVTLVKVLFKDHRSSTGQALVRLHSPHMCDRVYNILHEYKYAHLNQRIFIKLVDKYASEFYLAAVDCGRAEVPTSSGITNNPASREGAIISTQQLSDQSSPALQLPVAAVPVSHILPQYNQAPALIHGQMYPIMLSSPLTTTLAMPPSYPRLYPGHPHAYPGNGISHLPPLYGPYVAYMQPQAYVDPSGLHQYMYPALPPILVTPTAPTIPVITATPEQ